MCGTTLILTVGEVSNPLSKLAVVLTLCGQRILWPVFFSIIPT